MTCPVCGRVRGPDKSDIHLCRTKHVLIWRRFTDGKPALGSREKS